MNSKNIWHTLFAIFLLFCSFWVLWTLVTRKQKSVPAYHHTKCSSGGLLCTAKDHVSDPAYNIRQIVENSLLLEDHLTDANKLCNDCICKHFLVIHAYATEALALACDRVDEYPHMKELPSFYDGLYQRWKKNKENEQVRLQMDAELRNMRKRLMAAYLM